MKKRALIKILAAPEDLAELRGVFDHLRRNGVVISEEKATLRKKDIVLAVLSERFYGDEELKAQLFDQLAVGAEYILPLNLADTPVPEEIMNLLFARNIIMSSGRSDEELAERILSAIPEKKNPTAAVFAAAMAILLLLGGLFLWRTLGKQKAEPVIAAEDPIPIPFGITQEELAEIRDVVIIGDRFLYYTYDDYYDIGYWPEIGDFAYEVMEADGSHWYSTEDGHAYSMTRYDDLRFLELMPNLSKLRMVLVDVDSEMLPDLSGAERLADVSIRNCSMADIDWLSGSPVSYLDITGTNIASFASLSDCRYLSYVTIDGQGKYHGDFSAFAPHALIELRLQGMNAGLELSSLSQCTSLRYLLLNGVQIRNVDFLKEMPSLEKMELQDLPQLQDISGVAEQKELKELQIWQCNRVRDYMPINACRNLERISMWASSR